MSEKMYLLFLFLKIRLKFIGLSSRIITGDFYVGKNSKSGPVNSPLPLLFLSSSLSDLAMQLNQGKFEYNGSCG